MITERRWKETCNASLNPPKILQKILPVVAFKEDSTHTQCCRKQVHSVCPNILLIVCGAQTRARS
jgi:hypothetical protein